jgi:uncharacterized protein HemX
MELIKNPSEPQAAEPTSAPQVNDVSAPSEAPNAAPTNDNAVALEPTENNSEPAAEPAQEKEKPAAKPIKPPKQSKPHGSGVAIFAAVVIVLALGAMFTYAYLRSQNISLR